MKKLYVNAPVYSEHLTGWDKEVLFLAGGISNCDNWQPRAVEKLKAIDNLCICNPRRENFDVSRVSDSEFQIKWEHYHLTRSTQILFWFCKETVQPIVLFELGAWLRSDTRIFIGVHPEYPRKQDVQIQTKLYGHSSHISDSLEELLDTVIDYNNTLKKKEICTKKSC